MFPFHYKVICQKGNWYVFGFCHKHQKFMVYSLSRMNRTYNQKLWIA
ncbi:MAG: WYL domain-containing protein [Spirochaetaceae bacterium]|nr:WYL domain-containing protein [Spirochaetaceae bacterium]MBQ8385046.1 WYL domain-containing protein [Spirochaetaceae bacterium]